MNFVDLEDVAEIAGIVLTEPRRFNAIYELVGSDAITQQEVATILSQQLN